MGARLQLIDLCELLRSLILGSSEICAGGGAGHTVAQQKYSVRRGYANARGTLEHTLAVRERSQL
jgi:hypothetical protein